MKILKVSGLLSAMIVMLFSSCSTEDAIPNGTEANIELISGQNLSPIDFVMYVEWETGTTEVEKTALRDQYRNALLGVRIFQDFVCLTNTNVDIWYVTIQDCSTIPDVHCKDDAKAQVENEDEVDRVAFQTLCPRN
ncbi:MAG: hypothetical protein AAFP76_05885 [Bacteroidota bacterium]